MMLYLANNNNSGHTDWTQPSGLYRSGSYLYLNNGKNNYNNYYYEPSYSTDQYSYEEPSSSSSNEENQSNHLSLLRKTLTIITNNRMEKSGFCPAFFKTMVKKPERIKSDLFS